MGFWLGAYETGPLMAIAISDYARITTNNILKQSTTYYSIKHLSRREMFIRVCALFTIRSLVDLACMRDHHCWRAIDMDK